MIKIGLLWLSVLCLTGCSCSMGGMEEEVTPTPNEGDLTEKVATDVIGEDTGFGTPIVNLTLSDGKITELYIDEISNNESKRDLGDEYQLSDTAIAPWHEQVKSLEDYILENGVESIELTEGKVVNEDLITSVTINVEGYIKTINKALDEAK